MRFAAVQFDIAWEDKPANHVSIERMIDEAGVEPGTFVLIPEMGDTGFSFNLDKTVDDRSLAWARDLATRRGIWLQAGYPVRGDDGRGRNCAAIVEPDGEVRAVYQKVHPFSYGKEVEYFSGGDSLVVTQADAFTVCPLICYDLRFPELWRLAAHAGAEVFTIGACWPHARQAHWRALLIARAIENQVYVVACNRVGDDPHLAYAGGSLIISPTGEVVKEGGAGPEVLQAELDREELIVWRKRFPALQDLKRGLLGSIAIQKSGSVR